MRFPNIDDVGLHRNLGYPGSSLCPFTESPKPCFVPAWKPVSRGAKGWMVKTRISLVWHGLASDLPNRALGKFGFITSIRLGPRKAQGNFGIGESRSGATASTFVHIFVFLFLGRISDAFHQCPSSPPPPPFHPHPTPRLSSPCGESRPHMALIHVHLAHQNIL